MTRFDGARRLADAALEATVVGSFSRIGFAARRALFDWAAEPVVDMSGRVALVTGATGGLGLAAATALAQRNADVWIVGRDPQRIEAARRAIAAVAPDSSVTTAVADLAVLDDVRNLADRVRRSVPRLDVLIHNAGALTHDLRYTADGLEVTAQVHVVAPFLLTTALLPILQATADARVITVSSGGMYTQRLDLDALATPAVPFNGVRAYANAKRAQVVLNELWSKHRGRPAWCSTRCTRAGQTRPVCASRCPLSALMVRCCARRVREPTRWCGWPPTRALERTDSSGWTAGRDPSPAAGHPHERSRCRAMLELVRRPRRRHAPLEAVR